MPFFSLNFFIQKPLLHPDPEFHLHIGGLLNPIPGKQKIHMYVVWGGWWLFQDVFLLIALDKASALTTYVNSIFKDSYILWLEIM